MWNKRTFPIRIIITLLCLTVLTPIVKAAGPKKSLKCVAPAYLKPGDKVAIITPSYYGSLEKTRQAAKVLRSWGFEPVIGPNVGKQYLTQYAGTAEQRYADLSCTLLRDLLKGQVPQYELPTHNNLVYLSVIVFYNCV